MQFEGWVANATGNISFNELGGSTLNPAAIIRENVSHGGKRMAIIGQIRRNPDRLLPEVVLNALQLVSSEARELPLLYILTAETVPTDGNPEGALVGSVHLVLRDGSHDVRATNFVNPAALALRSAKDEARLGARTVVLPTQAQWSSLKTSLIGEASYSCDYTVLRNGKSFIKTIETPPNVEEWLAAQCYYFIKDCLHFHYHHHHKSDAIIDITEPGNGGVDWRLKTLRKLY